MRNKVSIFPKTLTSACSVLAGIWIWVLMGSLQSLHAQLVDVSNEIPLLTSHEGGFLGAGISLADFNGDFIDDLSFSDDGGELKFFIGTGDESGFSQVYLDLPVYPHESKMVLWCDIDNDGDQDLFITYRLAPNRMYRNLGDLTFEDISATCGIDQSPFKSYGACFGDYNSDGLLDLFVCNYSSGFDEFPFNELYTNLGGGQFEAVTSDPVVDMFGIQSFQGQWVDFNGDGLLDLHVVRDRTIYANYFFQQQPAGSLSTFSEVGVETGLDLMINCMSTSVADYDRDLDEDVYMTAFPGDMNWLMVNNDGDFSAENATSNQVPMDSLQTDAISWAGNWFDADNNGWEDLHVATGYSEYTNYPSILTAYSNVPDRMFYNTEGIFSASTEPDLDDNVLSFATAVGDFNLDGFPDLVSHRVGPWAQILRATPNENHWLKFWLEGTTSNRDGTGAVIEVWTEGMPQSHRSYAGENYLGQNSRWEHFGLGAIVTADSVVVNWPSGTTTTYFDVSADEHYWITEGEALVTMWADPDCGGSDEPCSGCTYQIACNYNELAQVDDGSCDFGCLINMDLCGPGTVWSDALQMCTAEENPCPMDLNGSGLIDTNDLLLFLSAFSIPCSE